VLWVTLKTTTEWKSNVVFCICIEPFPPTCDSNVRSWCSCHGIWVFLLSEVIFGVWNWSLRVFRASSA
jgi:hypothetical protein